MTFRTSSEFADKVIVVSELVFRRTVYVSDIEALMALVVGYDFHNVVLYRGTFYLVLLGSEVFLQKSGRSACDGESLVSGEPDFFGVGLLEGNKIWLISLYIFLQVC